MSACPGVSWPTEVPADWKEFTDWGCGCPLYYPSAPAAQVAPVEWEPCPPNPTYATCEWMKHTWTTEAQPKVSNVAFAEEIDGTVLLGFTRLQLEEPTPFAVTVVAEADGVARAALHDSGPATGGCVLVAPLKGAMDRSRWALTVLGDQNEELQPNDKDALVVLETTGGVEGQADPQISRPFLPERARRAA